MESTPRIISGAAAQIPSAGISDGRRADRRSGRSWHGAEMTTGMVGKWVIATPVTRSS
jgi:hypothetical protein